MRKRDTFAGVHLELSHHPATPPSSPIKLWATVDHAAAFGAMATTNIWFGIGAPAERFLLPHSAEPSRRDGLWQTTCFEAFLQQPGSDAYREWNFAPSGDWAAYDFTGYREGMSEADIGAAPYIRLEDNFTWFALGATIATDAGAQWQLGLSAVLEEKDGTKSYWALAQPKEKPDFHHPDCFTAKLA
ncbi:DOMON-like domain-containing protein [Sphingomonas sinipercae]|uniref:DOMON-like domain-containing protein n=1 Tax=Sphingomonas sinipercae TaxID=2714944 RepID=A0A6G7ZNY4_9SPHN|nr:DOMON-like domain-containing protein [Sphingomonas sinipercae]QIL02707.1 DOMON-like domain-containing protein [Sphingomonas sinipercae]